MYVCNRYLQMYVSKCVCVCVHVCAHSFVYASLYVCCAVCAVRSKRYGCFKYLGHCGESVCALQQYKDVCAVDKLLWNLASMLSEQVHFKQFNCA